MKATKYIAIGLGIVAILLVAGWFLRNIIIERISKPILAEYDVTVTDVSLDALATSDASISYLELEHVNGTTVGIDELTLPIGTSPSGFKTYSAERITIDLPEIADDQPLDLASALAQLLALPLQLQQTEIIVGELGVATYPVIRDLRWQLSESNQKLSALVEPILLTANIDRISDTNHSLNLAIAESIAPAADQSISVDILRSDTGISLIGTAALDLPRWRPVSTLLGIDAIDVESGSASLHFEGEITDDLNQASVAYVDVTPTTPVRATYFGAADASTSINVRSASTIEITATFPDVQWSLRQAQASLLVSDGDLTDIPVSLVNLSCQSGITCSADINIDMENARLPFADVGRFEFAATQDVALDDDGLQVHLRPDAILYMSGISGPDLEMARFSGRLTSTAELGTDDAGWHITARSADVEIEQFSVLDNLEFSANIFLDDISVSEVNQQPSVQVGAYASSSQANFGGRVVRLPGFKGGLARQGEEIAVFLETDGLFEEASIEASHNLDDESGQLSLVNASLSFVQQALASRIAPWPNDWNISAGTFDLDVRAEWQKPDNEWRVAAQTSIRLSDLAGAWDDTAFTGLSTMLDAAFDTATGFTIQPATIEVALVEMGLPLENITAGYTLYPDTQSIDVEHLHMTGFGGVITADPFSFSTANERNTLLLRANSIDLAEILSIKEFEAIEISGSIAAELPVTIEGKTVRVDGGTLTGEAPGGVIRYLPGINGDQTDASSIGVATRALSNFEYETLTSEVDYTGNGDLNLRMRLTGRNPDLEDNRPVILNLGLENNIPQMLRSLQAARAVEDILERRLAQ